MVKPINLRQAKKQKLRKQKQENAAKNRVKFGIKASERKSAQKESELILKKLDSHLLDK